MASISDIVARLRASPLPVLFADTCILLDVIRAPSRPDRLRGSVKAAIELLCLLDAPETGYLIVASFVPGEWQSHAEAERKKLEHHFRSLDEWVNEFHESCAHLGMVLPFGLPGYSRLNLGLELFSLSEGLLRKAILIDSDDLFTVRASRRVFAGIPPSTKGAELKDCTILEECLEVARQLQTAGYAKQLIFCTSNVNDYCKENRLHPSLEADFHAVGLTFTNRLDWAVHELKK